MRRRILDPRSRQPANCLRRDLSLALLVATSLGRAQDLCESENRTDGTPCELDGGGHTDLVCRGGACSGCSSASEPPPAGDPGGRSYCQHRGACYNWDADTRTFRCNCLAGYTGEACETDADECAVSPCRNRGFCAESSVDRTVPVGEFRCDCVAGYTGKLCETEVDELTSCTSAPCQHNGTCFHRGQDFTCDCAAGFTGELCETAEIDRDTVALGVVLVLLLCCAVATLCCDPPNWLLAILDYCYWPQHWRDIPNCVLDACDALGRSCPCSDLWGCCRRGCAALLRGGPEDWIMIGPDGRTGQVAYFNVRTGERHSMLPARARLVPAGSPRRPQAAGRPKAAPREPGRSPPLERKLWGDDERQTEMSPLAVAGMLASSDLTDVDDGSALQRRLSIQVDQVLSAGLVYAVWLPQEVLPAHSAASAVHEGHALEASYGLTTQVRRRGDWPIVTRVLPGSSADGQGVEVGHAVLRVGEATDHSS